MDQILTVSELTAVIKQRLENEFRRVNLEGEISNFTPASSGHWYFTLKDENAVIQAVMFQNKARFLGFVPANGMKVMVTGAVSVYAKRGNYQIICEHMQNAGQGRLLLMLEERKQHLAAEGLFDPSRKKKLPLFPTRIAIVTSPTGAAIRDILQVLARRAAGIDVIVVPAAVQGDTAASELTEQLLLADRLKLGDVIIIGRGGGSLEDLLPFSDEGLVRAIASCSTPVISAVGHEIDTSLSDFAADLRAPTPSAAAELVAASREDLLRRVMTAAAAIIHTWKTKIHLIRANLSLFRPKELVVYFKTILNEPMQRIDDAKTEIISGIQRLLESAKYRLTKNKTELEALSPFAVLERGYAIVRTREGNQPVTRAAKLGSKRKISIQWQDAKRDATIED